MTATLLWINKDAHSTVLSRSGADEALQIRKHVRGQIRQACTSTGILSSEMPSNHRQAIASSLRPNHELSLRKQSGDKSEADHDRQLQKAVPFTNAITPALSLLRSDLSYDERRSLHFFDLRTSKEWSGWRDATFWSALALPMAEQSAAVAKSLIAISTYHESMLQLTKQRQIELQALSEKQGSAALALLARSELSHLEALVSCAIVLCFQNVKRHSGSPQLLRCALNLLAYAQASEALEGELAKQCLQPLFDRLKCRICAMADPTASFAVSLDRQRRRNLSFELIEPVVPDHFESLAHARRSLLDILQWAQDNLVMESPDFDLDGKVEVWQTTLATFKHTLTECKDQISADLLRASMLCGYIMIETVRYNRETAYDKHMTRFHEILMLVDPMFTDAGVASDISFGIDSGLIDMVSFVSTKCRDPILRRRGLHMLRNSTRAEGERPAPVPASILEAHIMLEEEGLDVACSDDIPESCRYRLHRGEDWSEQVDILFINSPYDLSRGATLRKINVIPPCPTSSSSPHAFYGPGYAEFVDDIDPRRTFRLEMDNFFWMIPKA